MSPKPPPPNCSLEEEEDDDEDFDVVVTFFATTTNPMIKLVPTTNTTTRKTDNYSPTFLLIFGFDPFGLDKYFCGWIIIAGSIFGIYIGDVGVAAAAAAAAAVVFCASISSTTRCAWIRILLHPVLLPPLVAFCLRLRFLVVVEEFGSAGYSIRQSKK